MSHSRPLLSRTAMIVLQQASERPRGNVCPTPNVRDGNQEKVLAKLQALGFIVGEMAPIITYKGREYVAEEKIRKGEMGTT